jgi:radical SAM protein with 4Fe4S-binding SPASM domain
MNPICEQATGPSDALFWHDFSSTLRRRRVPISGALALNEGCNLSCIHCYAKCGSAEAEAPGAELSTGQWIDIMSQVKEAGCLYLLLTGGEPLLRDDFAELYSFAKTSGFLVTLFTNGTLVTEETAALLRRLPPRLVEISLYGATAATHDRITGVPGSFDRARRGIEILIAHGIHVGLKSVLMKPNLDEFRAIEDVARGYGVKFRLDAAIFPSLGGDHAAIELRVPAEQAVDVEFSDPDRVREWRDFLNGFRAVPDSEKLYMCGAGRTTFYVDARGWLYPCLMVRAHRFSLLSGRFQAGWDDPISLIDEERVDDDFPCRGCQRKLLCGFCPGFFALENGRGQAPSEYLCALGTRRHERINSTPYGA